MRINKVRMTAKCLLSQTARERKINGDNKSKNANTSRDRPEEYATQIADISIGILSAVLKRN